jgi:pimeloyl-ACP methyl ester carboxylesterase
VTGPGPTLAARVVGSGPPVVLLHGQPGSAADWDRVVPLLADDLTVVVPDRPGYGRTGGPAVGFVANAAAVVDLLDRLGLARAVVVGHSWGGGVAITVAGRHPDRVAGMVLLASVGPDDPVGPLDRLLASWPLGDALSAVTIGGGARLLGAGPVRRHVLPRLPAPVRTAAAVMRTPRDRALWRSFAEEQRSYVREVADLGADLAAVRGPVTVVTGTVDHVVGPAVAAGLAAAVPGAELVEVPGVGHLLPHDAPGAVARAVRRTVRPTGLT